MDERSVIVTEDVDVNQDEPVSLRFTVVIACLLFTIFFALFITNF
jgi:hypothetical protein